MPRLILAARCAITLTVWMSAALAQAAEIDVEALRARLPSGIFRWGGDAEGGAPFQLRDPDDAGRVIGFEVELADAIAERLGRALGSPIRAQFVQYDWVSLFSGLEKGDFDVAISGLEMTDENRARVRFSRPYYRYAQQLVVRADETAIATVDDCRGKIVGTLSGSAAERLLKSIGVKDLKTFDGQVEPYLDLEFGRVDAVLLDTPIVAFYASPNPKLRLSGEPIGHGFYGIAMRSNDDMLAAAVDQALGESFASGRARDIFRKWRLWNADQAALAGGADRAGELAGLGFDAQGEPLAGFDAPPANAVDTDLMTSSAERWTFAQYAPVLVRAAGMTVFLTVTSMALAMVLGLVVCVARLYGPAPVRWLALVYVEFFRGIPLLLLLFFLYFGLAAYGLHMDAVLTAIIGFGMTYAAYESEIYRSAIEAVPSGQWEAARALAMRESTAFRKVVLPQAIRTALGPMTNDFVALFKDTSLVSVIAVRELTKEYLILARSSSKFVEIGLLTAILYLMMSVPLGYLSRYLEKRFGGPR